MAPSESKQRRILADFLARNPKERLEISAIIKKELCCG
jgi:hypothetical protein